MSATPVRKRILVALAVFVLLAAMLLTGCGGGLEDDASGEEVYNARCSSCHRKDLRGGIGPPLGPGSDAVDRPLDYYEITITTGKGRMPSFGSTLTDAQISRVIEYVIDVQNAG
jgi:mono/diheme cytochrome c family protein